MKFDRSISLHDNKK